LQVVVRKSIKPFIPGDYMTIAASPILELLEQFML